MNPRKKTQAHSEHVCFFLYLQSTPQGDFFKQGMKDGIVKIWNLRLRIFESCVIF